jgi:hypothetical protein
MIYEELLTPFVSQEDEITGDEDEEITDEEF